MDVENYIPFNSTWQLTETFQPFQSFETFQSFGANSELVYEERPVIGGKKRSASRRASLQAAEQQREKAELDAAMRSMAYQLAVHTHSSNWHLHINQDSLDYKRAISFAIPTENHIRERKSMIFAQCDIASRLPPFDEQAQERAPSLAFSSTDHTSLYSYEAYSSESRAQEERQTPLQYACSTFIGRVVSADELGETSPRQRFANSWMLVGNDTWVNPHPTGTSHKHGEFSLPSNAFGENFDIESDVDAMERQFEYGRHDSEKITHELLRTKALGPSKCVQSDDDAMEKLNLYFQEQNPLLIVLNGQNAMRQLILKRFRHLSEGKRYNRRIQNSLVRFRNKKGTLKPGLFVDVFSTADLFKFVVGHLAPREMARLLQTTKWGVDIQSLIRKRMPSLCIYELPGFFPHMKDANGNSIVHKDTQISLAVGFCYQRQRTDVCTDSSTDTSSRSDVHAFEAAHTCEGAKNVDSIITFESKIDDELENVTVPSHAYFASPPTLDFELVEIETGLPHDIECPFGGMTPEVAMQKVYGKGKSVRLHIKIGIHHLRTLSSSNFAVLAKFGLKNVHAKNKAFKILATATGIRKSTANEPLVLKTESFPFYIRTSKSNAQKAPAAKRLRAV